MDYSDTGHLESLCKLHLIIAYEGSGNFTKFNEAYVRSGLANEEKNDFSIYNTLFALSIQGIVDMLFSNTGIRWIFNKDCLNSNNNHIFGTELLSLKNLIPTIYWKSLPVGFKKSHQTSEYDLKNISSIGMVTDQVLYEEPSAIHFVDQYEKFSIESFSWVSTNSLPEEDSILRIRERFTGFSYFIYLYEIKKVYKVIEHEWLFAVSSYLLNFDISRIVIEKEDYVKVPASFKLPTPLNRFLFEHSAYLELGFNNKFIQPDNYAIKSLKNYLEPRVTYE